MIRVRHMRAARVMITRIRQVMHHELRLLADAGIPPSEALRAATSVAADRFRPPTVAAYDPDVAPTSSSSPTTPPSALRTPFPSNGSGGEAAWSPESADDEPVSRRRR